MTAPLCFRSRASALPMALLLLAAFATTVGCQRIRDTLGMGDDESGEGSGAAVTEVAPGTPGAAAAAIPAAELAAELPTGALDVLPGDADLYVLLDIGSIRRLAQRLVPGLTDDVLRSALREAISAADIPPDVASRLDLLAIDGIAVGAWFDAPGGVLVVDRAAVRDLPGDDEPAQALGGGIPVMVDAVGDYAVLGLGPPFVAATGDEEGGPSPREAWTAGWDSVPEGSVIAMVAPDVTALPAEMRDGMPPGLDVQAIAWGYRLDGAFGATIRTPDDSMIRAALGSVQQEMFSAIDEVTAEVPPQAGNLGAYLALQARALWSQVDLSREGDVTRIQIGAATCGSINLTSLALTGAVASMFEARAFDPNATWTQYDQPVADGCAVIDGPEPNLPVELARLAPADTAQGQFLTLIDMGALLRHQLPTGFGVMPFALRPEDVVEALGPRPLGLDGLADPGARLGLMVEGNGSNERIVAVVPDGMLAIAPSPPPSMSRQAVPGFGTAIGTPDMIARASAQAPSAGPWADMAGALSDDAVFAFIMSSGGTEGAGIQGPLGGAFNDILSRARLFSITLDADMQLALYATYDGNAVAALESARSRAEEGLREELRGMPEDQRRMASASIGALFEAIHIERANDTTARVTLDVPGMSSAAMTPFVLLGAFGYFGAIQEMSDPVYIEMPPGGEPDVAPLVAGATAFYAAERVDATGKALPQRFPRSAGPTPDLASLQAQCATGSGVVADPSAWMSEGWQELNIMGQPFSYSPMRFALSFESSGVGPDATFTATAWRDADCDGTWETLQQSGTVVDGNVVVGPRTTSNPGE